MKKHMGNVLIPNKFFENNLCKAKNENKFNLSNAFETVIGILS